MSVSSVGAAASTSNPAASETSTKSALAQAGDFMQLLAAQLANQDPMAPMDNSQFVAQLAQFSSLEESQAMHKSLDSFIALQQVGQASALVGQNVEYVLDGDLRSGRIDAATLGAGETRLSINGQSVPPGALVRVLAPTA